MPPFSVVVGAGTIEGVYTCSTCGVGNSLLFSCPGSTPRIDPYCEMLHGASPFNPLKPPSQMSKKKIRQNGTFALLLDEMGLDEIGLDEMG